MISVWLPLMEGDVALRPTRGPHPPTHLPSLFFLSSLSPPPLLLSSPSVDVAGQARDEQARLNSRPPRGQTE